MPLTQFICPDKQEVDIGQCLNKCRMTQRCLTLPTLINIVASERPWDGHPSTTRLQNGTMLEFLKATTPYAIDPKSRSFALLGNNHHDKLAAFAQGASVLAEAPQPGMVPGTPDILEEDENSDGHFILTDYKTYGSYRVVKMLGLEKTYSFSETEVYKSSGKWGKAGSPKRVASFNINPLLADLEDEQLQLNHYRILLEAQGYPITQMRVQATVRDGGLQAARERGITGTIYLIDIPRLPDYQVESYFERKRVALVQAVTSGMAPKVCNDKECWGGRRCQDYCEVASSCPKGEIELGKKRQKNSSG